MEALSKLGIDFKILIAQIINFGILMAVLIKLLYKPLLKALENRKKKIAESLKKAEEIERKAAEADADYNSKLSQTKQEMQTLLDGTKKDAETLRHELVMAGEKDATRIRETAQIQIENERQNLYTDARHQAGKLALILMSKAFKHAQGEAFYRQSIDSALKEMENNF